MAKKNAKISKSAHVVITDENESKVEFNFSLEKENGSEFLKMNVDFGENGSEDCTGVIGFVTEKFLEIVQELSK